MAMPADEIAVFITADVSACTSGMNILICLARDTSIATEFFYLCVFPDFLGYCRWILMDLPADLEKRKVTVKAFLDRDTIRQSQVFLISFGSSHSASLPAQARRSATRTVYKRNVNFLLYMKKIMRFPPASLDSRHLHGLTPPATGTQGYQNSKRFPVGPLIIPCICRQSRPGR